MNDQKVILLLRSRGVEVEDIAQIVYDLQKKYSPQLSMLECIKAVEGVLAKREVQYIMQVGIALDIFAEKGLLDEALQELIVSDEALFNVDEVLAMGIVYIYGTIGITSFGYLDKKKVGIIGDLDGNKLNKVNTFLDDLVAAIASAASAKIAHV